MGEYEPNDSRDITATKPRNPIEPERTGTREEESRRQVDDSKRGNFSKGTGARDDLTIGNLQLGETARFFGHRSTTRQCPAWPRTTRTGPRDLNRGDQDGVELPA